MSLVEQAMQRMRNAPKAGEIDPGSAASQVTPLSLATPAPIETPRISKRLIIELHALRDGGYLPEQDRDRQFADHYRQIKTPLIRKALGAAAGSSATEPRVIMVTSALPGDGKTFTSINLALSLARERDLSVLLVDADLPKPHVSKIFGIERESGLLDALVDDGLNVESLVLATNIRGLSILPAGNPAEGTSELLSSDRMRQIARMLCAHDPRRLVLLDSPPLLITSEGRALIHVAGQVVLVVRAGQTPRQAMLDAIALFPEDQDGGLVLNEATAGLTESYYGYGYGSYGNDGDAGSPTR